MLVSSGAALLRIFETYLRADARANADALESQVLRARDKLQRSSHRFCELCETRIHQRAAGHRHELFFKWIIHADREFAMFTRAAKLDFVAVTPFFF